MLKFLIKLVLLFSIFSYSFAQKNSTGSFSSPLDIPLFLSGNYGELRATHFHAGVDFRTQSVTGKQVLAAADGFISRINIQSGGYGKSLYISHPNGFTTVYAHLERFIPAIEKYVKENQYAKEQFEIELFPEKDQFIFTKGELIAYSGNTGSSGGPHLHFEIRNTNSQVPLNGLLFNFPVSDNVNPEFKSFYLYQYPFSEPVNNAGEKRVSYPVTRKNDSTYSIKGTLLITSPYFSFGSEVYDYLNGSSNRCGIYYLQFNIDNKPYISYTINNIPFSHGRYVNAHMDYELKMNEKKSIHRLYPLMNNKLEIYNHFGNTHLYQMNDDSLHKGEVIVSDSYGNKSRLKFTFRQSVFIDSTVNWQDSLHFIRWDEGANYSTNRINIQIPPNALYQDIVFNYSVLPGKFGSSDTFNIFTEKEPLHESIKLEVPLDNENNSLADKLIFCRINGSGKLIYEGGSYNNGIMSLSTRSFGKYIITCDTVSPVITPINFVDSKQYSAGQRITFTVTDDLSGLYTYKAYIDKKWVLMEYDAKSDNISYTIDPEKLTSGSTHSLKIMISDRKQNRTEYNSKFYY